MPTLYENFTTPDNDNNGVSNTAWRAQTFTVGGTPHSVTSVRIKAYRNITGSPSTVTLGIRAVDESSNPTGSDLTSGTSDGDAWSADTAGDWHEFTVTEYTLLANTEYAIVVRCAAPDIRWKADSPGDYTDGTDLISADSGSSWTPEAIDDLFEVYGNTADVTIECPLSTLNLTSSIPDILAEVSLGIPLITCNYSLFAPTLSLDALWDDLSKNTVSMANNSKNTASMSNSSKNTAVITNASKNTASASNSYKSSSTWLNLAKS